jgi:AraC family transcriptional regulator, regulatory protein of adaptative response / methylated-DNA-[protein]-cysteine methyltransferase
MPETDYERIRGAIEYVAANFGEQPSVSDVARSVHLSPYHFSRLFRQWAGVTPKQFLQHLTVDYAKKLLTDSRAVLDVAHASGLSGPGRLHDHLVTVDAVSPGEYKRRGEGVEVRYGLHETLFGSCLVGVTDRGICYLSFADGEAADAGLSDLRRRWPRATVREDATGTREVARHIGCPRRPGDPTATVHLRGTNFQLKVWQALLAIPPGAAVSYGHVGAMIGQPTASRAIGSAVGANPIASLIPCHRVLRKTGGLGGYRWGEGRKVAMLGLEAVAANR